MTIHESGPSFLKRMEKDEEVRTTIKKILNNEIGVEDLKTHAKSNFETFDENVVD